MKETDINKWIYKCVCLYICTINISPAKKTYIRYTHVHNINGVKLEPT